MSKLILLSIVLFTAILPLTVAKSRKPQRTLKMIQWATFIATLLWAIACRNWYPTLVVVD